VYGLDSSGVSCKHGTELSGSTEGADFY